MARIGVDPSIYEQAEVTAKADHPESTTEDIQRLAEAFQRAYEDWALDMEAPEGLSEDD